MTGSAQIGEFTFCCSNGDFDISGPGLRLFQGTPDGPSVIGSCAVGSVCDFSFSIGPWPELNNCCSSGSVGSLNADYLLPDLTFTGSALYSGGDSLDLPMTISGTVIGYKLVNCEPGFVDCSLSRVFTLRLKGQGEGTVRLIDLGEPGSPVLGEGVSFSGTATVVPEPASLILTATGLMGLLMKKKKASRGLA
jgi:hypothetical protein